VPVVTTRCPCSSTWGVLDRELWVPVLVLVLVTWVLDISLVQIISLDARAICCLQDKYEKNQYKRQCGIFRSNSFFNKILWFTLSKALLKSISKAMLWQSNLCLVLSAMYASLMSAHVLWNAHSNIQTENHQTSATNCSLTISVQILQRFSIKQEVNIGRKSVSSARGGFILGTKTTSFDFRIFGKCPSEGWIKWAAMVHSKMFYILSATTLVIRQVLGICRRLGLQDWFQFDKVQ